MEVRKLLEQISGLVEGRELPSRPLVFRWRFVAILVLGCRRSGLPAISVGLTLCALKLYTPGTSNQHSETRDLSGPTQFFEIRFLSLKLG